jgi:hypothetical protein
MTAEIAILNQMGVALAADSAVTVGDRKVYNTANKLFALSKEHPVGIMVYGSASFMGIPWETLIKIYRRSVLKSQLYPTVDAYAQAFLDFIKTTTLVTPEHEEGHFRDLCIFLHQKVIQGVFDAIQELLKQTPKINAAQVRRIAGGVIQGGFDYWNQAEWIEGCSPKNPAGIKRKYGKLIAAITKQQMEKLPLTKKHKGQLETICAVAPFKKNFVGPYAGIVIAGFGEDQIYPALYSCKAGSRVSGVLKYVEEPQAVISTKSRGHIRPFAQNEMVSLFMEGIDPLLDQTAMSYLRTAHQTVPSHIEAAIGRQLSQPERDSIAAALGKMQDEYQQKFRLVRRSDYVKPVIDAVVSLPLGELAVMAETLVNLTSFKRKMTLTTETVGGPIDVAVISKGDGLIWIKRKHYFAAELNKQYFDHFSRS